MASRVVATLDPHRLGESLALSQGNQVVTTTAVCDVNRAVFGTLAAGAGQWAFECFFWSTSQPTGGLVDLSVVGVAEVNESLTTRVGEGPLSWGFSPANGRLRANAANLLSFSPVAERKCIGVFLDMTGATPICAWHVDGNLICQANLTPGVFYVPAVSIGSNTPADVSAYLNFGQTRFHFPLFSVLK